MFATFPPSTTNPLLGKYAVISDVPTLEYSSPLTLYTVPPLADFDHEQETPPYSHFTVALVSLCLINVFP